jgi:hypothetical protein
MPETFPTYDPETRSMVETEYLTLGEIADFLHLTKPTAKRMIEDEDWPHLVIARRIYVATEDFGQALEGMRRGGIPDGPEPRRLGVPILSDPFLVNPEDDAGGIR